MHLPQGCEQCYGKFRTWENVGIIALLEKLSERNIAPHVLNTNDETRNRIPDEVSELSIPDKFFDRLPHTHHNGVRQVTSTQSKSS